MVTGASSGIGREVALRLARSGYKVAAAARRLDQLELLAAEAASAGGVIVPMPGDVTDRKAMDELVSAVEARHGPVALAFLNVGTFFPDSEKDFGGDGFRMTFATNVEGTINLMGPLIRAMRSRGRGQIAVNASVAGYGGLPRSIAYSSSKAALIAMCEAVKFDLDKAGLTIQVVCPGFVKTPLTDNNDFPMPFLIPVEEAGKRICDGFERGGFEIAFPRRMAYILKFMNMLPYGLYFALLSKITGR
ncbi:MAG: SDR family NAD(P)-dependent oxidoreductase [Beijerinckiaceae bacterium]|nr:SDR family NAD(P)-dependent oxidoreductase [Beijerinckiaceae bacterium]